jgi:hypothetical protein
MKSLPMVSFLLALFVAAGYLYFSHRDKRTDISPYVEHGYTDAGPLLGELINGEIWQIRPHQKTVKESKDLLMVVESALNS